MCKVYQLTKLVAAFSGTMRKQNANPQLREIDYIQICFVTSNKKIINCHMYMIHDIIIMFILWKLNAAVLFQEDDA